MFTYWETLRALSPSLIEFTSVDASLFSALFFSSNFCLVYYLLAEMFCRIYVILAIVIEYLTYCSPGLTVYFNHSIWNKMFQVLCSHFVVHILHFLKFLTRDIPVVDIP